MISYLSFIAIIRLVGADRAHHVRGWLARSGRRLPSARRGLAEEPGCSAVASRLSRDGVDRPLCHCPVELRSTDNRACPVTGYHFIGAQVNLPIPLFNTKRGEILQAQAQRQRIALELHQTQVNIQQDVETSLARLAKAKEWAQTYEKELLPNLRASLTAMEKLFLQGDPGADVLRLIDMRRKLLRARDGHLDALWEIHQAQADLAVAVGEIGLTGAGVGRPPVADLPRK